jgi:hypothetical protein
MSESMDLFAPSLVAHFWPRGVIKARIIAIGREQVARLTGEKASSPITTSAGLYDLTDGRNGPPTTTTSASACSCAVVDHDMVTENINH